jgi:hypothetical protein
VLVTQYLKHILGASENRLDFRQIMNEGKVLLVDLGQCDPETRRLVGSLVTTGMEMAAMSRIDEVWVSILGVPKQYFPYYSVLRATIRPLNKVWSAILDKAQRRA